MKIASILPFSTVDWMGTTTATIFTTGCNIDCPSCHNHDLIHAIGKYWSPDQILDFLLSNARFIKGVVITGGEPTLQPDIIDVITIIKRRTNLAVYVNSNGTMSNVVHDIVGIIDGISIDIKTIRPNVIYGYDDHLFSIHDSVEYAIKERYRRPSFSLEVRILLVEPLIYLDDIPRILSKLVSWSYNGDVVLQEFDRENVRREYHNTLTPIDVTKAMNKTVSSNTGSIRVFTRTFNDGLREI